MADFIERTDFIGETDGADGEGRMNTNEEIAGLEKINLDEETDGEEKINLYSETDGEEITNSREKTGASEVRSFYEETNGQKSVDVIAETDKMEGTDTDGTVEMDEDTQRGRFLTFSLGNESYGIEIVYVTEIIGIQAITEIPELPEYINGIINLRGKIIPVMDVRLRFKKEPKEYNDRTCVIVVDIRDTALGLIVDSVSEVLSIPEEDIVSPPQMSKAYGNRYIKKIGKVGTDVKLLLDCQELLIDDEIDDLREII